MSHLYKKHTVNQDIIDDPSWTPRPDLLGKDQFAMLLYKRLKSLEPGSIVALQAGWGQGKTDVLSRVAKIHNNEVHHFHTEYGFDNHSRAIWINPWQYGEADLLSPLIIELLKRVKSSNINDRVKNAAKNIARAGAKVGTKALTLFSSGSEDAANAAETIVDKAISALTSNPEEEEEKMWSVDPVASMGKTFTVLVNAIFTQEERNAGARLMIFIDDVDRCLPDRQIALLEALNFVTASNAPANFIMALDHRILVESLRSRYKISKFNPELYLDKIFALRVNLPDAMRISDYIESFLDVEEFYPATSVQVKSDFISLRNRLSGHKWPVSDLVNEWSKLAAKYEFLTNARLVKQMMNELRMHALSSSFSAWTNPDMSKFIVWLYLKLRCSDAARFLLKHDQNSSAYCNNMLSQKESSKSWRDSNQQLVKEIGFYNIDPTLKHVIWTYFGRHSNQSERNSITSSLRAIKRLSLQ